MLGIITTLSSIKAQPVYSKVELNISESYIIQTSNIVKMKLYGTDDSLIRYSFNIHADQVHSEEIIVSQTNAQVSALADVAAASNVILLPVYEDTLSFADAATLTPVDTYFNVEDIVWISQNAGATLSKMIVCEGGFKEKQYIINYNLEQIIDLTSTGTTTTTTTTTE